MSKPELRSDMLLNWTAEDIANHLLPWIIDNINNGNFELMKEFQGDINKKWEIVMSIKGQNDGPIIPDYCYDQCKLGNPACPTECQNAIQQAQGLIQKIRDVAKLINDELAEQGLQLPGD